MLNGPSEQISFRLAAEYAELLDKRATEEKMSPGKLARKLLVDALTTNSEREMRHRVAEIQEEVQRLREELFSSVHALLVYGGKVDKEQAGAFVRKLMK